MHEDLELEERKKPDNKFVRADDYRGFKLIRRSEAVYFRRLLQPFLNLMQVSRRTKMSRNRKRRVVAKLNSVAKLQ